MDEEVELWWNKVKDNDYWSGAIVNLPWDQLWDDAKENLKQIAEDLKK